MDNQIISFLQSKKLNVIKEDIDTKLAVWEQWYKGHVDRFHTYKVYSGKKKLTRHRRTLNMAARVCQDWADLLINEKVDITVSDEKTQNTLDRLLRQVNFYVRGNNLVEIAFAHGGGFFIQYFDGEKVNQKYITQKMMYPISFDSGKLTEAAFVSEKTIKGKKYVYIETHLKNKNGYYVIENFLLERDNNKLKEVSEEFYKQIELETKIDTQSSVPSFQMIRPNVANKDNFDSPYGTSVFSGSTDQFAGLDIVYDGYIKEIELGKRRIFAGDTVSNVHFDENGNEIRVFDSTDEVFYLLKGSGDDERPQDQIHEVCGPLRVDAYDKALQSQLNLISQSCGFGANGYKWDSGNVATATQVISENSKMFRTLKKHEEVLKDAIIEMAHSLLNFEQRFGTDKNIDPNAEITVNFDDSIIEDTAEIRRQAMMEYNAGLIDAVEYYERVYKMSQDQAQQFYKDMLSRKPAPEEEPEPEE